MKVRRSAAIYFAIQGIAVFVWWGFLIALPDQRAPFLLERESEHSLLAFWLADLVLLILGSAAASWLCYRNSIYKEISAWLVTGAVSYAALYCLAFAMISGRGWLGVVMMFAAMIWSGVFSVGLTFRRTMFRQANESGTRWIVFKTFAQIVIVWSLILVAIPNVLVIIEKSLGIPTIQFSGQRILAILFFLIATAPGLAAAYVMSTIGMGTPLPLDHARKLVVKGPYAYVRNPMALSGIAQGLAVALYFGSPMVAIYALMGSAIWQFIFRPLEEEDMADRFGEEFEEYRQNVRCWVPRLSKYSAGQGRKAVHV